ncbi:N-acetylglucosamine-6-phosphate deacetylase [Robiginitomaculum antarcticum]|uniref:N-acetylglucosamine-6-phosphate deacetylase n=1 Tax=Robiginitomaculum antarcticum TaxID=437507 RepID=UPI00035CD261|nr:N-acetylglucosamine-6-phosphate deacetylase [Robiginitomaculum antarcticum]
MNKALINANVLTPEGFKDQQSVLFDQGRITRICDDAQCPKTATIERNLEGLMLLPGFIDVQVNGGGGILFNDNPGIDSIKTIGNAHRAFGTTGFLPTLISDNPNVMSAAIAAVDDAIAQGVPGVLGIHLEGPFLNEKRRGVHDASKFRKIGEEQVRLLSSLKRGKTLVTLAPEMTTPEIIKALRDKGVIVSAGHTEASYAETLTALDAGLTGFTHLFNAMTPLESRHPGVIAAALEDPRAWCSIIADGHHVHPAVLRLALRAKIGDQVFLVTDAMPSVGAEDKQFSLGNIKITVADGKCLTQAGTLAGSDLDMIRAVRYARDMLGVSFQQAVRMASTLPAQFLGLGHQVGEIKVGQQADFIVVNEKLEIKESWINGRSHTV